MADPYWRYAASAASERGFASHSAPGLCGLPPGATIKGYPSLPEDPALISQRRDVAHGISRGIPDMVNETPISSRNVEESSILFVDGLPSNCTRREVAHLFRPFIGFREIRLVHKEPRHVLFQPTKTATLDRMLSWR